MKRLHFFNLFGVVVLVVLCAAQWYRDRRLNLDVNRLEKTRLEQAAKLTEQEQTAKATAADLAQFKEQFDKAHNELADALQKLRATEHLTNQLTVERDQLKTSITNWSAAVTARDERLKEANTEIKQLGDELNASIHKFNELVTNYNAVVTDLKDLRARVPQSPPAQPPEPKRNP